MPIGLASPRNSVETLPVGTTTCHPVIEKRNLTILRPAHAHGEPRTWKVFPSVQGTLCGLGLDKVIVQYRLLSLTLLFAIAPKIALDLKLASQAAITLPVQR